MPLQSVNKAAHYGFETQGRCHQKPETGVSVPPPPQKKRKKDWKVSGTVSEVILVDI